MSLLRSRPRFCVAVIVVVTQQGHFYGKILSVEFVLVAEMAAEE